MNWRFWEKAGVEPVSTKVRSILARERGVNDEGAAKLRMIAQRGQYSDRPVTYFRVFDPEITARAKVVPVQYRDLSTDLIAYAGHIEHDGSIVLNRDPSPRQST